MLIQRAILLDGTSTDIRVETRIVEMDQRLAPRHGEDVYDAGGGAVVPGLHDHHLHLRAAAAAMTSVHVGPDVVRSRQDLARILAGAAPGADGWLRAIGYHDAAAGALNRSVLDELCPAVPLRVQHRSGVQWVLNSRALNRVGLGEHPDGRLFSADLSWSAALTRTEPPIADFSAQLSRYGVTGVTDATPGLDPADIDGLLAARRRGELRQTLHVLAPGKRILHDDDLDLDELIGWIRHRHADEVPVAVHCVTAAQLVVTVEALRSAGSRRGDRIEHAAIVPGETLPDLAALGVTVVTQPNFVAERGDQYLTEVPAGEHDELWRVASLCHAGVPVALSTDAPFGATDPWAAMRAAVTRRSASGSILGPHERVSAIQALTMFLGDGPSPAAPRCIQAGAEGDVCVLSEPPDGVLAELDADLVAATVIAGEVAFERV